MACNFDGTNYLGSPDPDTTIVALISPDLTVPYTIACWIKTPTDYVTGNTFMAVSDLGGNNFLKLTVTDIGAAIGMFEGGTRNGGAGTIREAQDDNGAAGFSAGAWHSVVIRLKGSGNTDDIVIHVDGDTTGVASAEAQTAPDANCVWIGSNRGNTILSQSGDAVARACVIDGDVTSQNITDFDAGGWPATIFGANLIAHYDFASGALTTDETANGYDLTEYGAGALSFVADPAGFTYAGGGTSIPVFMNHYRQQQ